MGGVAGPLSLVPDLSSAVPALGAVWVLKDILSVLAEALNDEGYLDLRETFIDGSFAPAKKAGPAWERRSAARDRRSWRSPIVMGGPSLFTLTVPHLDRLRGHT